MSEWYHFGYRQGLETGRAHDDLGLTLRPDRQHIAQLLRNMGVDLRTLSPESANLCYQGYVDAIEGRKAAYAEKPSGGPSELPSEITPAMNSRGRGE